MYILIKDNVERIVDSEEKMNELLSQGFIKLKGADDNGECKNDETPSRNKKR